MTAFVVTDAGWVPLGASGLPNSGVAAGTYGDSTHVGQFTVDAHGIVTAAAAVAITGGGGGSVNLTAAADVLTDESTSSTSYTDLATVGPQLSITVGASGLLLVGWNAEIYNAQGICSVALSGANTVAASDAIELFNNGQDLSYGRTYVFVSLAAGSTTATVKYRSTGATAHFLRRSLWALAP